MSPAKSHYSKPALTVEKQAELLQGRGLIIGDMKRAMAMLSHLNYYRFSAYCLSFETQRHCFAPGTTFEQVEALYEYDRVLRDLVSEALEVVEVDFRTAVAYHFGHVYGAFGHTSPRNFYGAFDHEEWTEKLHKEAERSSELFIEHFRATYQQYPDLPIWMATEVMSFGGISQMFKGMLRDDQVAIARRYRVHSEVLKSWMHHLVFLRNVCAHHSRLWGRVFTVKPELPRRVPAWQPPYLLSNERLHCTLLILNALMTTAPTLKPFAVEWRSRVAAHLSVLPHVPDAQVALGLPATWKAHPLWR